MSKQPQNFYRRPEQEQAAFLEQTWCQTCMEADLGMHDPEEYLQDGSRYIEGKCNRCGNCIITELTDEDF